MEAFAGLLMADSDASFGVVDKEEGGRLLGHVGLYNCDHVSGVASLAAFFDQRSPVHDWVAAIALRKFLHYVFTMIGLRKIHFEMPDTDQGSLGELMERLPAVRVEGVLQAHVRIGSEYRNMLQAAVWAEDFAALGSELLDARGTSEVDKSGFMLVQSCLREMGCAPDGQLTGGMRFAEDLGLDSLSLIELWVALEERLGRPLADDSLASVKCVQDLVVLGRFGFHGGVIGVMVARRSQLGAPA